MWTNWLQCLKNLPKLYRDVQSLLQWKELQTIGLQDEVLRLRADLEQERKTNADLLDMLKIKINQPTVPSGGTNLGVRGRDAIVMATRLAFEEAQAKASEAKGA